MKPATYGDAVLLDGNSLGIDDVVAVARHGASVSIVAAALERLERSRQVVERAAVGTDQVYGVNTGFGKLASVRVPAEDLAQLQRNLVLSHASGTGEPLPVEVVRGLMLLRANSLLKPMSGVRPELARAVVAMLNAGIHPVVPEQGSVGASGDLAPLAHVALGLIGEGDVDVIEPGASLVAKHGETNSPTNISDSGAGNGESRRPRRLGSAEALAVASIEPVDLGPKEGLALVNGTQAQTAILTLLIRDSLDLWRTAHAAAAMSLEALKGTPTAFDHHMQEARPHAGQVESAALLRALVEGSEIRESHRYDDPRVQDAYSLRCTPQVHGAVKSTFDHAADIARTELNSTTDNPLVCGEHILSGGNFHGQPIAMALDFVAIALTTLAGIAERRLDRIMNPELSSGLPAFLAIRPGLESGVMMLQICAASLVAECRVLSTPACVQSIPTNANQEDFVPMGMTSAMKARRVLENTRRVIACELICAAQGLEYRRPLRAGPGVEKAYDLVREVVAPLTGDRSLTEDISNVVDLMTKGPLA